MVLRSSDIGIYANFTDIFSYRYTQQNIYMALTISVLAVENLKSHTRTN